MSSILKQVKSTNRSIFPLNLEIVAVAKIQVVLKSITQATIKSMIKLYENSRATLLESGEMLKYLIGEIKAEKIRAVEFVRVDVNITR